MNSISTYYDTTKAPKAVIKAAKDITKQQDQLVAAWYKKNSRPHGPSQCYRAMIAAKLINRAVPLTSVRRSINTLTKQGVLKKTDIKAPGDYGRPELCWQFVQEVFVAPKQLSLV